jgi:hypothetical protein
MVAVAMLLQASLVPAFAQSRAQLMHGTYAYALAPQNASGTGGSVALTAKDADHTIIVVRMRAAGLADLRAGACGSLGGHTFISLNPTLGGASTTTVHVGIVKLAGGSFSVRVKDASGSALACANIAHANLAGVRP